MRWQVFQGLGIALAGPLNEDVEHAVTPPQPAVVGRLAKPDVVKRQVDRAPRLAPRVLGNSHGQPVASLLIAKKQADPVMPVDGQFWP